MLTRRLPNGVMETVIHSEPGQEGCRDEAHRAQETYLDDSLTLTPVLRVMITRDLQSRSTRHIIPSSITFLL